MIHNLTELYRYRSLVSALVARHMVGRYRGSVLGFVWTLLNPLLLMGVYTLVFRYYIRFSEVDHYAVFLFCGLLPWIWVSGVLIESTTSIISSGHLVTKSAFPAHILPTVTLATHFIHFILSLPVLWLFLIFAGKNVGITNILWLILIIFIQLLLLNGATLCLSALNVFYRDIQHIIGNVLNLVFFLCPIIYPFSTVPTEHQAIFLLNPFAALIHLYQQVLFDLVAPDLNVIFYLGLWATTFLVIGNAVFDKYKEEMVELL
jgi:lipopolysaccharide transport system permease protein